MFKITTEEINHDTIERQLQQVDIGAIVTFKGTVRNHHKGKQVDSIE